MSKGSSRGTAWELLRKRVLDRDGWLCQYCGRSLEGADATADHLTPVIEGGQDTESNLVACCRSCNGAKGGRVLARTNWFNRKWLDSL